jgi:hypothetical protein
MPKTSLPDQLGFVAKVLILSTAIAIALKTIGPQLPLPATATTGVMMILAPALIMGTILCWQLWTSDHAHPTHVRRN